MPAKTKRTSTRARDGMQMESLEDLFVHEIKDLYSAEQQILKALPKMIREASSQELQAALQHHLDQTKGHVDRLDQVFEEIGEPARAQKCKGMEGLIEEGSDILKERAEDSVKDAGMIAAAQRVEHYEMAAYGTVRTYARTLGHDEAVSLLDETLREEKEADKRLTEIAESAVNLRAVEGNGEMSARGSRIDMDDVEDGEAEDEDDEE